MADMIFQPRRLHVGDIVRTEDKNKFCRVIGLDKDFVYLENDEQRQRYYFSVYPIKLQDTRAMIALGAGLVRKSVPELCSTRREYSFGRGDYVMKMSEIDMGYFRVKIRNISEYQKESDVESRVFYYFHEIQQYFFERTNTELLLEVPNQLDFELESCYYFDDECLARYV